MPKPKQTFATALSHNKRVSYLPSDNDFKQFIGGMSPAIVRLLFKEMLLWVK